MKAVRFVTLLIAGWAAWSSARAVETESTAPNGVSRDTSVPAIILIFAEADSPSPKQQQQSLAIFADGRAVVASADGRGRRISGQIPEHELKTLFQDLIVERRLLEIESGALKRSVRAARLERRRPDPDPDAATTLIRVRTEKGTHEIQCHALGLTASQLPDLTDVADLFACQRRLENVAAIIRAGGYDHVETVLKTANRRLRRQAPTVDRLTCRDLSLVDLRPDGTRYLQFSRVPDSQGLQPVGGFVMVSIYQSPGRPPEIIVTADAS